MKNDNMIEEKIAHFQSLCFLQGQKGYLSPWNALRECNLGKEVIYAAIEMGLLIKTNKKGFYLIGKRVPASKLRVRYKIIKARLRSPFTPFWRCVAWAVGWFGYEIKRKSIY